MPIQWIPRRIESEFAQVCSEYPVVTVTGSRQSGKTYVARLNAGQMPNLYFYRDARGHEVDLIIRQHRKVRPAEIKAAMAYSPDLLKVLKHFRHRCPDALDGAVIYAGDLETKLDKAHLLNFKSVADWVGQQC